MKPTAKQRLLNQVDKLLAEGEEVLATKFSRSRGNFTDMRDPFVENQVFRKWLMSCRNLARLIGQPASIWQDEFDKKMSNRHVFAKSIMGSLGALKDALTDDLLIEAQAL